MLSRTLLAALPLAAALAAQTPPKAPAAAAQNPGAPNPAAVALPEADSDAANAMLLRACATMSAVRSGSFTTDVETDMAMLRGQGLPMGEQKAHLEGGWDQEQRWAKTDGDTFVVRGGRMVAETESGWRLRASQLPSGAAMPFVLQPRLLFAQIGELPAAARRVVHIEAGKVGDREVAILTVRLTGDQAADLALSGALPTGGSGGGFMMLGGMFGGERPQKTYSVDLGIFTALDDGKVLRLRAKVYEEDPMMANVQFRIGGPGGGEGEEEKKPDDDDEDEKTTDPDKAPIKKGLPDRNPARAETMYYLRADFRDFDKAKAPEVDANGLRWLTEN